jgi:hypothetical protein
MAKPLQTDAAKESTDNPSAKKKYLKAPYFRY